MSVIDDAVAAMDQAKQEIYSLREQKKLLRRALADAVRWLDFIEKNAGNPTLVNLMPNNCTGRNDMRRVLKLTE